MYQLQSKKWVPIFKEISFDYHFANVLVYHWLWILMIVILNIFLFDILKRNIILMIKNIYTFKLLEMFQVNENNTYSYKIKHGSLNVSFASSHALQHVSDKWVIVSWSDTERKCEHSNIYYNFSWIDI